MGICEHYEYDKIHKKYVSRVKRIRKHIFECGVCKVKLHDVDVYNLDNYINYLNKKREGYSGQLDNKADIYNMMRPVPRDIKTLR